MDERLLMPHSALVRDVRWYRTALAIPYLLLALLVVVTVISEPRQDARNVDFALSGLTAVWMTALFAVPLHRRTQPVRALFVAGIVAVTAVLVLRAPWFGFFTPAAYLYAFGLLRWPLRMVGVAAVAAVAGTAQASGIDLGSAFGVPSFLAVLAVNMLAMCGLAYLLHVNDMQAEQRNHALEQAREANRKLAASLAENAGLHRQLLASAREAGVLDERRRMAQEIHDTLAQGLTGIVTQLQAAEQVASDRPAWQRHLDAATALARESLTEARRSVHALRPQPLEGGRLGEAVAEVADRWSALHGLAVELTTTGTVRPLAPEAEFALLRTAQEALANVAKHARASRVGVTLSYLESEVAIDVRDDGAGFDPADRPPARQDTGGFGLVAMRQRIEGLAGTLQVESEPGGGTAISARVPATSAMVPS